MTTENLVVVGGSLAGLSAIEGARAAGFHGKITLIGAEGSIPYDRPPLSKELLSSVEDMAIPTLRSRVALEEELGVVLDLGVGATGIDTESKEIHVDGRTVPYDAAVIATGSLARTLAGAAVEGPICAVRTYDDSVRLRARLTHCGRLVIVGAGLIGSEVASTAREMGIAVTLIDPAAVPGLRVFGPDIGADLHEWHVGRGVDVRCGVGVVSIESHDNTASLVLTDGTHLEADTVVIGIGAVPATGWLTGSGVSLDDRDGSIICDSHLRAAPDVYAAGDVASWWNPVNQRTERLENWTNAQQQGAHAGRNAVTGTTTPYATVPYVWTDLYGSRIQFAGSAFGSEVLRLVSSGDHQHLVAVYHDAGRLTGVLCIGDGRLFARARRLVTKHLDLDVAIQQITDLGPKPPATHQVRSSAAQ